jgi:hypothetical protein
LITWSLQFTTSLLFLATGILGLAIARRMGPGGPYPFGWLLTGLALTAHGANFAAHNLWGLAAMSAGAESPTMNTFLRFAPAVNHSRTFMLVALCGLLLYLGMRGTQTSRRFPLIAAGVLLAGLAVGFVVGLSELRLMGAHFSIVARWDAVELLLLLGTLFYVLVRNAIDRYNWGVLAIYGFMLALNVVWLAALAYIDNTQVWSPSPRHVHIYRTALLLAMLALTVRRYVLARRHVRVTGLLDFAPAQSRLGLN